MKVAYIKHPCSPEQKEKYRKDGYKVVDSRFKPSTLKDGDICPDDETKQTQRRTVKSRSKGDK